MYAEERQHAMAALVASRGRLSVTALAEQYAVTTETVRRDLSVLERAGFLRRVHGGAVPTSALSTFESRVGERDLAHSDQKDRIARRAVEQLPPSGGTVLLDAGTTTARLALMLPRDLRLSVLTNAVPIAARLAGSSTLDLHLLPGRVGRTTHAAVGEDTVAALSRLRVDVAFLGTDGLTVEHGLSTPDHAEAAAKRAIIASSRRVVLLMDSSKLGQEHTVRFAEPRDVDVLVTDGGADRRTLDALERQGVQVVVA